MRVRHALIGALCALGLTLAGAVPALAAPNTTTIVLVQAKPVIVQLSTSALGETGYSFAFAADLSTAAGKRAGVLAGTVLTVDVAADRVMDTARHRQLVFRLKGGQIMAQGLSFYPAASAELAAMRPVVIAIVGGTGKYIGASGEVKTTRHADGTYRHVITLVR
ncbi:MAG: hypothetical protein NTX29_11195 [Actinobacteria bacterium]|nr:hypothetical protein [Actinomycetota bacterium]